MQGEQKNKQGSAWGPGLWTTILVCALPSAQHDHELATAQSLGVFLGLSLPCRRKSRCI